MKYLLALLFLTACGNDVKVPDEVTVRHEIVTINEPALEAKPEAVNAKVVSEPVAAVSEALSVTPVAIETPVVAEKLPVGRCSVPGEFIEEMFFERSADGQAVFTVAGKGLSRDRYTASTDPTALKPIPVADFMKDGSMSINPRVSVEFLKSYDLPESDNAVLSVTYNEIVDGFRLDVFVKIGGFIKRIQSCEVR